MSKLFLKPGQSYSTRNGVKATVLGFRNEFHSYCAVVHRSDTDEESYYTINGQFIKNRRHPLDIVDYWREKKQTKK